MMRSDRAGFFLLPVIALLVACAAIRGADTTVSLSRPPERLREDVVTRVEWLSPERVFIRCAQVQAQFRRLPTGAYACTFARPGEPVTMILPRDMNPLFEHEVGHANQLVRNEPVDHKGWE